MIKRFLPAVVIISGLCILTTSCGKHIYVLSGKEINRYAEKAKEPNLKSFVEYNNGDTIKGASLEKKHNKLTGKKTWLMDDKEIPLNEIRSYQDNYGYRIDKYSRILKGKMSLYLYQVDDSRLVTTMNTSTLTSSSHMEGGTHTSFYMELAGPIQVITLNSLNQAMKNCQSAIKQVNEEFKNTAWQKNPSYPINDYRALIRIINIYNNCN